MINYLENTEFTQALVDLGLTSHQELAELRKGFFVQESFLGRRDQVLRDHYQVWVRAGGAYAPARDLNNQKAVDGCDVCDCGCKYWKNDRCTDCGTAWDLRHRAYPITIGIESR